MAAPADPSSIVPHRLRNWLQPFRSQFTAPSWQTALVLVLGAILSPGRRTVAATLRVLGLEADPRFTTFHRLLNRNRWNARRLARCLLHLLIARFVPDGPIIVGLDDTLERRWGPKIKARGIYRDPVRSSHGHFVKASGLRWLSIMLLPEVGWAGRVWALPILTVLAPSERYATTHHMRHKKLTDRGRQILLLLARWLPEHHLVAVADSSFAAIDLLKAVRARLCMITRLRLDARLFEPPAPRQPGTVGRPATIGRRQPTPSQRLGDPATRWQRFTVTGWYGQQAREIELLSATAIWHHPGRQVPIRYVLVRDVAGEFRPQAFLCTDLDADPCDILRWFVRRWSIEVTFAEVRRHLGVETQRQWSDAAIRRTTPVLLGLFSLITLWADDLFRDAHPVVRAASWYTKSSATFSDAIASVRRELWTHGNLQTSSQQQDMPKIPPNLLVGLLNAACYPA